MAVPPPPTGEFDGFSYPPATFAAGTTGTLTQLSRRLDTRVLAGTAEARAVCRAKCNCDTVQWRGTAFDPLIHAL
jgi:hypothetical protein